MNENDKELQDTIRIKPINETQDDSQNDIPLPRKTNAPLRDNHYPIQNRAQQSRTNTYPESHASYANNSHPKKRSKGPILLIAFLCLIAILSVAVIILNLPSGTLKEKDIQPDSSQTVEKGESENNSETEKKTESAQPKPSINNNKDTTESATEKEPEKIPEKETNNQIENDTAPSVPDKTEEIPVTESKPETSTPTPKPENGNEGTAENESQIQKPTESTQSSLQDSANQ